MDNVPAVGPPVMFDEYLRYMFISSFSLASSKENKDIKRHIFYNPRDKDLKLYAKGLSLWKEMQRESLLLVSLVSLLFWITGSFSLTHLLSSLYDEFLII